MIAVKQLTKKFGTQVAVDELSFEIPAGQIVGFLGPNGAGKTTTLKMLTGMIEPTSGTATISGFDLLRQTLEVKKHVGFVPESGAVFECSGGCFAGGGFGFFRSSGEEEGLCGGAADSRGGAAGDSTLVSEQRGGAHAAGGECEAASVR